MATSPKTASAAHAASGVQVAKKGTLLIQKEISVALSFDLDILWSTQEVQSWLAQNPSAKEEELAAETLNEFVQWCIYVQNEGDDVEDIYFNPHEESWESSVAFAESVRDNFNLGTTRNRFSLQDTLGKSEEGPGLQIVIGSWFERWGFRVRWFQFFSGPHVEFGYSVQDSVSAEAQAQVVANRARRHVVAEHLCVAFPLTEGCITRYGEGDYDEHNDDDDDDLYEDGEDDDDGEDDEDDDEDDDGEVEDDDMDNAFEEEEVMEEEDEDRGPSEERRRDGREILKRGRAWQGRAAMQS
jgi:hypothetical protein